VLLFFQFGFVFGALPCKHAALVLIQRPRFIYSLKILTVSQSNYHAEAIFSATGIEMHAFSCSAYFPSDPYWERLLLRRMGGLLQKRKGIFVIIFSY
jgi:hypothetical protein